MIPQHISNNDTSHHCLTFRSVLPHEPPLRNRNTEAGYVLIQGSFLSKKQSSQLKEKETTQNSDGFNNISQDEIGNNTMSTNRTQETQEKEQIVSALKDDLLHFFQGPHNNKLRDFCPPRASECMDIEIDTSTFPQSITRARLTYESFQAAREAVMFLRHVKLSPSEIFLMAQQQRLDNRDMSSRILEEKKMERVIYSKKPLQVTHVTTLPLPSIDTCWPYVSPPKFRRLLLTLPESTDFAADTFSAEKEYEKNELLREHIAQTKTSTRYLYISGIGSAISELLANLHQRVILPIDGVEDITNVAHVTVMDAIRDLIHRCRPNMDGDDCSGVEVWIPNWNKSTKASQPIKHCYIGVPSHDVAVTVLQQLLGKSVSLSFSVPSWLFIKDSEEVDDIRIPVVLKAQTERLFLDWADVTRRSYQDNKSSGENVNENGRKTTISSGPPRSECTSTTATVQVPGLFLLPNFVSAEEERILLATLLGPFASWAPSQKTATGLGSGALKRRVQHYGYVFDYASADVLRDRSVATGGDCPPLPAVPEDVLQSNGKEALEQFIQASVSSLRGWDVLAGILERVRRTEFQEEIETTSSEVEGCENIEKKLSSVGVRDSGTLTPDGTTKQQINVTKSNVVRNNPTSYRFRGINQVTVNEYAPGTGIGSHIDTESAFGEGIMSITLKGGCVMEFRERKISGPSDPPLEQSSSSAVQFTGRRKLVYLPQRSLLAMCGDARYRWEHMIVSRSTDTVDGKVIPRATRLSLTLRTALTLGRVPHPLPRVELLYGNLNPNYYYRACNNRTLSHASNTSLDLDDPLVTPATERVHVHSVYDAIATQWNHTRGKRNVLWPSATHFIQSMPKGSVIADVGCGDGKYFEVARNSGHVVVGTDISIPLLQTSNAGTMVPPTDVVGADCMNLPLTSSSCDAALCIAVMHHLSTVERRKQCLRELRRIVKENGCVMVQAWALEQESDSRHDFGATDVLVPFNAQPRYLKLAKVNEKQIENPVTDSENNWNESDDGDEAKAAIVRLGADVTEAYAEMYSGAQFDPDKGLVVFQRYCHVYRQGELDELFQAAGGWEIMESGYESGNHYIVARAQKLILSE